MSHAKTKEQRELEEKQRLQQIEEQQRSISRAHGYGKPVERQVEPVVRVKEVRPEDLLPDTNGIVLEYEEIRGQKARYLHTDGIDAAHLEFYLSDAEFERVFEMTKREFVVLPQWKRGKILKAKEIF